MYYPDQLIEEVRSRNDIVDVVSSYVHIQKKGASYFGLCPFHNEKSPSFSVSPGKQMFYCFGCGAGGNVITFLMKYENYTFQEALKVLADRAGIALPEIEMSEELRKKEAYWKSLYAVNKEAATYYYKLLRIKKGAVGLSYLEGRELSADTMKRFGLGFADGAGSDLTKYLQGLGYSDQIIMDAGLAAFDEKRGIHDKFWNRVMFPIQDVGKRVIGFGGRVMGDGKPKYLNSPETPIFDKSRNLYGLHLAKQSRKSYFILCEGYMDVIAMHQAGFTQAIASLGTAFTIGQASLIKRYVKDVVLSYDSDQAGITAALRGIRILKEAGLNGKVLNLTPYKDPDEFMKAEGAEAFAKRIEEAENCFFYEMRMAERDFDLKDPAGRTGFQRLLAKKLCAFPEELERDNYLNAMAEKYFIDVEALRKLVASYHEAGGEEVAVPVTRPKPTTGVKKAGDDPVLKAERYLLTWLVEQPELYPQIKTYISVEDFQEGMHRQAAERLFAALEDEKANPEMVPATLVSLYSEESDQQAAATMFHTTLSNLSTDQERERAFRDIVYQVKKNAIERGGEDENDPNALMKMINAKRHLETLSRMTFKVPKESK